MQCPLGLEFPPPIARHTHCARRLGVMGQNYALNIASKGFKVSVCNRSYSKTETCVRRAAKEDLADKIVSSKTPEEFIKSIRKPRKVLFLVKAGQWHARFLLLCCCYYISVVGHDMHAGVYRGPPLVIGLWSCDNMQTVSS